MDKIPVTVIVPVKNEEKKLPFCLKQLTRFSQVIVIDSSSTDSTPAISLMFRTEYQNFKWNGKFPKKRNWALHNLDIKNDWVLFLDADEILTPVFIDELSEKIKNPRINGYWITYLNHFMDKKLRFGDQMKKLPLFRKGKAEFEKIEEDSWSNLDMEIHEHPIVTGLTGTFKSHVIHNDYKGLEHYISKHNAYSSWEAKRYVHLQKIGFSGLTFRQKIKYRLLRTSLLPFVYFIGSYVFKMGFLDGKTGYFLAKYKANYFFQIQTKIEELKKFKIKNILSGVYYITLADFKIWKTK